MKGREREKRREREGAGREMIDYFTFIFFSILAREKEWKERRQRGGENFGKRKESNGLKVK